MLSTTPTTYWSAREVAGVLPWARCWPPGCWAARLRKARLVPALSVALACYLAALGYTVAQPSIPAVTQNLADWLAANHLTYGLSSYGISNTTTLASGETVNVRPVSWESDYVAGGPYEFDKSWYDPTLHYANFVVLINPPLPHRPDRALGGAGLVREAAAHLLLQPLHHHGLQQEPADQPRPVTAPGAPAPPS